MHAYQSLVARMLETMRKDYWKPDKEIVENLAKEYVASVREVGLACCDHTCNNPSLTKFTSSVLMSVPGMNTEVNGFMKALEVIKNPAQPRSDFRAEQTKKNEDCNRQPEARFPHPMGPGKRWKVTKLRKSRQQARHPLRFPICFLPGFCFSSGALAWATDGGSEGRIF